MPPTSADDKKGFERASSKQNWSSESKQNITLAIKLPQPSNTLKHELDPFSLMGSQPFAQHGIDFHRLATLAIFWFPEDQWLYRRLPRLHAQVHKVYFLLAKPPQAISPGSDHMLLGNPWKHLLSIGLLLGAPYNQIVDVVNQRHACTCSTL